MNKNAINLNNPAPLYEQILLDIKSKIEKGELKPGEQIGSQIELSTKYNVSLITVKKALSTLITEGILYSRIGRGTYVAEKPVKKFDLSNNKTIGLVLRDLKHPYFSMIVHSIEEKAYEMGFSILLAGSSGDIEKEENQIKRFRDLGVDGLIIASLSYEYKALDYIQALHNED
ncbi:MAG: GntR family transcriptional regulator, partial [Melioribacteraceae bacterium]